MTAENTAVIIYLQTGGILLNSFIYSDTNKRYHTLNYYYKHRFGNVQKAIINAGFSCPNIDGTKGVGGCSYCNGAGDFCKSGSISEQLKKESERIFLKHNQCKLLAYFQPHTNTYAPISTLKKAYYEALNFDNVFGIAVATRADCIDEDVANLLCEINKDKYVSVELGLQTIHDDTAKAINRCHDYNAFLRGYDLLKSKNIRVCVHIINGLPNESQIMMNETAKELGRLRVDGIKIHSLHIVQNTAIFEQYNNHSLSLQTKDEYINTVVSQLEVLPPETVIERLTGDGDRKITVAPSWSFNKKSVLAGIDKTLAFLDTTQGAKFSE